MVRWVRGERVMLDADLARLYGVDTRALNRAVRRNAKRFPSDFMFLLVSEEVTNLKCQIGISSSGWGGRGGGRGRLGIKGLSPDSGRGADAGVKEKDFEFLIYNFELGKRLLTQRTQRTRRSERSFRNAKIGRDCSRKVRKGRKAPTPVGAQTRVVNPTSLSLGKPR